MRFAVYSGCTVLGRARNYEMASRAVARAMGIEFIDIDRFECCGFPLKSVNHEAFMMTAAANIFAAEMCDVDICTLCSACTSSLTEVNKYMEENFNAKARMISTLRRQCVEYRMGRSIRVKHFVKILHEDIGIEHIRTLVKRDLAGLRFAAHYGCHYLRPAEIYANAEDPEHPFSLDELIRVTGAETIDYEQKLRCCGAGVLAISEELAYSIARPKLRELSAQKADAIVLMCPFCSVMFDDNQRKIEQKFDEEYNMPVLYYPQVLGLALGIDERSLGLRMNRVPTRDLLQRIPEGEGENGK
ncbi:CoB--CoM heterodisulfide reductase iron-sulfur subunit B family protein [candidate division WOR-3 bacterium]|nr:CoB--CoM heterodisulfide reductase iron-sulfur subunit B family protein [candidate division WOR-3 bacterium]